MPIQQGHIYSGVQVIPWLTTENQIVGVLSQGPITAQTSVRSMILAVEGGLGLAEEVQLRKSRSVFWTGSRNHLTGLHEYFIDIPAELSTRAGFNFVSHLVMEKATIQLGRDKTETAYYLRAHSDSTRMPPPGAHKAVKLWHEVQDQRESRGPDVCQYTIRFPQLQHALVELITDKRYEAMYSCSMQGENT